MHDMPTSTMTSVCGLLQSTNSPVFSSLHADLGAGAALSSSCANSFRGPELKSDHIATQISSKARQKTQNAKPPKLSNA
jgi:hypothetical protein